VRDSVTLTEYADVWADEKREIGRRGWEQAKAVVVNHVLPHLGDRQVRDIGVPEVRAVVKQWLAWMERGDRSAHSVHNIHTQFSSLMELAVADEIVWANPCKNQHVRKMLPPRNPQTGPCYTDEEVWVWTTDERVPWDRRMLNAAQAFAGMRRGEAAGRRWRDWDREAPDLSCMHVHSQYQDVVLKAGRGQDRKPRKAPVHPAYERMLRDWWGVGYEQTYCRPPTLDDFIVPDRRNMEARTRSQLSHAHERDARRLGVECKGTNAFKRHFETYATLGGAREDMLERITHNRRGTIVNVYIDQDKLWPRLCEAVRCLKVDLSRGQVISLEARRGS
jgi:integrase